MVKKTYTYEDFDGNTRTEDFYFNLTKAELSDWFNSVDGGMPKLIDKIIKSNDIKKIMESFQELIRRSYGEKSPDGRRFIKNEEVFQNFAQTNAYSMLYMELMDENAASEFIQGVLPKDMADEIRKQGSLTPIAAVQASPG